MTRLAVILLAALLLAAPAWAQQELRAGHKGATGPEWVTSSNVDANTQALDVYCKGGCAASGTQDVNVMQLLGVAPGAANPFPQRLSTGVAFYDARDRNWTLASGTDSVTVIGTVTAATMANVGACPSGAANFTVAASNASRKKIYLWGAPNNTADVFVKNGVTATTSNARIAPGQAINDEGAFVWTGQIDALPASGTQAVCLLEYN